MPFIQLFRVEEGRLGVVVTFMAILELVKEQLLELVQNDAFAPIHVRARVDESGEGEMDELDEPEIGESDEVDDLL
ncbi:segregation and condensation protein A [compost metagenome]